jgi:lysozyme family protein
MAGRSGKATGFRMAPVGEPGPVFQPGQDYFSVSLVAVHMPGKLLNSSKFAPVIWASLKHAAWDGERTLVGMFPASEADRPAFARNDRVEIMDLQLTPRVISQEEMSVDFTLGAVKEKDFLAGALAIAGELASSPAAGFFSQLAPAVAAATGVIQTADSVKKQLDVLLDQDKLQALGQLVTTLRSPLKSGLYAFTDSEEKTKDFRFNGSSNTLDGPKGPLKSAYVVVRLQREDSRPDWNRLPDLNQAWLRIREAALTGGDIAAAIKSFRVTALTSPDLTRADANKVVEAAEAKFAPVLDGSESAMVDDPGGMGDALTFFMETNRDTACGAESAFLGGANLQAIATLIGSGAFSRALSIVLEAEGGYVNHPNDPGGATNMGVTQRIYDDYRKRQNLPKRSVKDLEQRELEEIYFEGFWRPAMCQELPNEALAVLAFDSAVNHGPNTAIKLLQQAAGVPDAKCDGKWGADTRARVISAASDAGALADAYLSRRERYYRRLVEMNPRLGSFLKGWLNRVAHLRARVDELLSKAPKGRQSDFGLVAPDPVRIPLVAANPDFTGWTPLKVQAPVN